MKRILPGLFLSLTLLPGGAAERSGGQLESRAIAWRWDLDGRKLTSVRVIDKLNGESLDLSGEAFQLVLGDGTTVKASDFTPLEPPKVETLKAEPDSPTRARQFKGRQFVAKLAATNSSLAAEWRAILREGSSYVRQELSLRATDKDVLVREIVLFDQPVAGAYRAGTVDGSPVVAGTFFIGYEHPMAQNRLESSQGVRCRFSRNAILRAGETLTQSCVIGVVPRGQLRRGFLAYVERERAHPYRPFLHYNSWYDIAWATRKFDEAESLDAMAAFGRELVRQRGVRLDSFLFDDGWDDSTTLWQFHRGFPNGFTPLKAAAEKLHAGIGVWVSPFGGYGDARRQRLESGHRQGFETNASGFSLAGPKYYQRFHDLCLEMIERYHVNQFKFDGLAAGARANAGEVTRDGDAMLRLIADLRRAAPNLYLNQTTGTWPSPFWLLYVDSTWRGGSDHAFAGKGSARQQWITYRDRETYRRVVQRSPLYPLNSLMLHGIIYATHANQLNVTTDEDFADEVHAFFGSGTQLQELYLTPRRLNPRNWNDLAEAARWSRANADVLVDTHWVGGDPGNGEVYGWASWTPRKGILTLRNPDGKPAAFTADLKELFELPRNSRTNFRFRSPWQKDRGRPVVELRPGQPYPFNLQPFEVLVLETL